MAEPPQEALPYGRWADVLWEHFHDACQALDAEGEDLGEPQEVAWFPDRSWNGRIYVPAAAPTTTGYEMFGYVSFRREHEGADAVDFQAHADFTDETVETNPDWELDLSDAVIGTWRGPEGRRGDVTLVWGESLIEHGAVATAELGPTTTDQCILADDLFTLVSLDAYTGDYLEIKLYGRGGGELAAESLYDEDEE
jgi:hypothetical protein